MILKETIFERVKKELGYETSGSLCAISDISFTKKHSLSSASESFALEKARRLKAHYVYFRRFDSRPSQPLIYVYDFTNSSALPDQEELGSIHRDIWSSSEVPCAFIFTKDSVSILNTAQQPLITGDTFTPVFLLKTAHEVSEEIKKRFSSYRLDSGEFWNEEGDNFAHDKSAHQTLLIKLRQVRERFIDANILPAKIINKLLIQCVLIRFLEEKEETDENGIVKRVFPHDFFKKVANTDTFKDALISGTFLKVFRYLNDPKNLNGKIFNWTKEEEEIISEVSSEDLVNLLYGTKIRATGQISLWDLYSFRFLPVEVISSIYEALFTTEESVKKNGMVYTPPHLASFLTEEAMPLNDYKNKEDFKLLDPACGSGIFLVLAFKRLVHWWRLNHNGQNPDAAILTEILKKSIYGVDSNENAVLLTRFSLCLAVCDMLAPPDIWDSLHFPSLENQLVKSDFFVWFPQNEKDLKFDLVIGNPPFVKSHKELPDWKTLSDFQIPQKQVALYFLSAGTKLLKEKGLLCLLLKSSSILYGSTSKKYRNAFFEQNRVHQIVDLTLLARNNVLWSQKDVDTCALFISNEAPDFNKNILHLTIRRTPESRLKKYFEVDSYDFHIVPYYAALNDDFIWKSNLLGGGRIAGLVKTLRAYPTLKKLVKKKGWTMIEGYRNLSNDDVKKFDAEYIHLQKTLPTEWLTEDGLTSENFPLELNKQFERIRTKELFVNPHIVIREIIGEKRLPMAFFDFHLCFKRDIVGISAPKEEEKELKKLFNYLQKYNTLFCAFILAISPRTLVYRNTSIRATDIYEIPVLTDINNGKIALRESEKIVINDINNHYRTFITQPETTKVLHPIKSKNICARLSRFSSIFCKELNEIYEEEQNKFRLSEAGTFAYNNFILVIYRYDAGENLELKNSSALTKYKDIELENLLNLEQGHVQFKRIVKIYKKDYVCFIKPNQLRYWLDSIALRDADAVMSDLIEQGY